MGVIIASLLPYIIGSALVPIQNIVNILLLKSPQQGLLKSTAYVAGMTTLRLLQGLIFGLIIFDQESGGGKSPVAMTFQLMLGVLLLITAYKKWRNEEDPDAPPPKWLTTIDSVSPFKAFWFGFGMVALSGKAWVFTLGAISSIAEKELGQASAVWAFILFVLLAQSLMLLSILFRVILPGKAMVFLEQASAWVTRNNRMILLVISLIFGLLFLFQGASGLLSL